MKKIFLYIVLIVCVLSMYTSNINAQRFKDIAIEDTTSWLFAHKQLAGEFIDTLIVSEKKDSCYMLNYKGVFFWRRNYGCWSDMH